LNEFAPPRQLNRSDANLEWLNKMKIVLITLLTCFSVGAQTKDEFKKRFGDPVSETFMVRPGIVLTASYTPSGQIRELLIAPEMTGLIKSKNKTLSHDLLREIIDELLPAGERGKFIISSFLNCSDCGGTLDKYESVTIYYNAGKDGVNYAVIQWKSASSEK
jgi:hypothetical protein